MYLDAAQEHRQYTEDFRRTYLLRALVVIGVLVWVTGMTVLFLRFSGITLVLTLSLEALCWFTYRLSRGQRGRLARQACVAGLALWWLVLTWTSREPALLFMGALLPPLAMAALEPGSAVLVTLLAVLGQLFCAAWLLPATWTTWPVLLAPFLTLLAMALALLWNLNLDKILTWALQSTRTALERLEEVQEHRGQLQKSMQQLDAAYARLERANEMLAQARAEAEAARQARNQFAITVSHELRTPLGFVIGFSELMVNSPCTYADPADWPPGLYEDVREIYHSSNHLMRLVNDILDLSRAEAQRMILLKEWIAPRAVIEEAVTIMRAAVAERNLALEVDVDPNLPELFVDRTRIRQVLINLVGNSLRFTEQGSITLSARLRPEGVQFCVRDTGAGIAADDMMKVFETFGQANATVWRRRGGSGLGVPISRRFVEMHGGRMWLESEVGQGTAFFFTLPLPGAGTELPAETTPEEDEFWAFAVGQPKGRKVVVLLSPDPNAGELMAGYVEPHRVVATDDTATARQYIVKLLPQALILDRSMAAAPDVVALVQSLPYDLPVFSFRLPGSAVAASLPSGVRGYLLKPILRQQLIHTLQDLEQNIRHLLVVDDDPAMSRFVALTLAAAAEEDQLGKVEIRLAGACTGQDALDYLRRGAATGDLPDAILLDLGLPDMTGWDVLNALQDMPGGQGIPVILITAASLPEELDLRERRVLEISTGRPLTQDELTAALNGLLQAIRPKFAPGASVPTLPAGQSA